MSSLRIGFCALQVGHHDAWTAIRIGLPAFCAAAKDFASKVLASMATAGAEKLALAATAARMTERRDSMIGYSMWWQRVVGRRGVACTSQSADCGSNSGHCAASSE